MKYLLGLVLALCLCGQAKACNPTAFAYGFNANAVVVTNSFSPFLVSGGYTPFVGVNPFFASNVAFVNSGFGVRTFGVRNNFAFVNTGASVTVVNNRVGLFGLRNQQVIQANGANVNVVNNRRR